VITRVAWHGTPAQLAQLLELLYSCTTEFERSASELQGVRVNEAGFDVLSQVHGEQFIEPVSVEFVTREALAASSGDTVDA
jgi:hypothetical protein